ncbi:unnamed protein product [Medioppia subpectinata]|uniref:F-box domain-containing protein n=1 Tax=Medioppia subpectinata TaxID=1979941 RepID=A0A7R9KH61_9ACAR|nr:unnamed protein product [Medioppia subpectinata]CAG2102113.1 unnamed protein product [Medioppia subpectinata]
MHRKYQRVLTSMVSILGHFMAIVANNWVLIVFSINNLCINRSLTTDGCEDRQQPQIYTKNSMDRFGDDLCQLLLSYLSFEDRFQCESVSKQFQRTVFGSVVCIEINDRFIQRLLIEKTINTQLLATIAIKCPKIETIDCRRIWISENREHIPEVLAIFRDNCLNLREIYCNLWQNSGQTMPTIGPLVTRINVMDHNIDTQSLTHCHRLSELRVNYLDKVFDNISGQLMAKNLQKYETHECLTEMCGQLSRLTQLRELTLILEIIFGQKSLSAALRIIGENCKQLKRLSIHFYTECYTETKLKTLDSLAYFYRLKRLELLLNLPVDGVVLDPLKHCKRLTHLVINNWRKMDDTLLIDCHKHCPRLQFLHIYGNLTMINTRCLAHISRLPALQRLAVQIYGHYTCLSDSDCEDLLSSSPKLKNIEIRIKSSDCANDMAQQLTQTMASLETTDGCEDRQQPKIYAKKSMDRFGDDLCQLLLSYLSFEDWFQCESVSKQFQRTVFGSVDCIEINDRFMQQILKTTITETLATIAIKCPKIETIDCRRIRVSENREHIPEVLAIFRDNCLNLPEIYCNVWQNSGQTMPTIGPLMTRIRVIDDFIDTQSLTHCHRLSHLSVNCLSEVVDTSGQIMAKNLQQIVLNFYSHEHQLSAFVAHNQSLKCFVVENYIDLPEETLNALTAQLSRLPQLRELTLSLKVTDSQHSLTDSLRPIGVNCKQLKRLSLDFIYTENYEFNRKTFDWLRYYRRLKRLVLRIYVDIDDDVLDPLRHCRRLTHLNILLMSMNAKAVEISIFESLLVLELKSESKNMAQQLTQMMASLETTDGCEDRQQPQIYAKNSMDRFGDDLCQLLLSYLSFEDLFQCECVSKQFRRTVFESVVCMKINYRFMQQILKTRITETLATIAIKCPNIETIDCRGIRISQNVLVIFRDNFRHLREIYCNLWETSGQTMATIGPLVTRIHFYFESKDTQALTHCHRLSHLRVDCLSQVFDTSGQLMAKNLSKFTLRFYSDDDYYRLSAFVAQNESLKCLDVYHNIRVSEETLTGLSAQLSRFTQLRELKLTFEISGDQTLVTDFLRTIGVNCKQLKRLSLQLLDTERGEFNRKTLDSLRFFCRLTRLELHIYKTFAEIVLDPLLHCKRLTHLELDLFNMTANVLKDLHIKCPRLQYLFIHDFHSIIDTECLSHISRLPALQMLVIQCKGGDDLSDNDFSDLLSRSPKLKTIEVMIEGEVQQFSKSLYSRHITQQMKYKKTSLATTDDGNEDISQQPQIYAKDSLDRFGDDLCQLLLSYLSLEDRFRLECVSKQFQRTVFTSVVDITLTHRKFKKHYKKKDAQFFVPLQDMAKQKKHTKTSLETTDDGNVDDIQQIQIYAKNSMDRFGDDLCQLLLSYLSLEDRFRLECVSKQFQRTVFKSVVDMNINDRFIHKLLINEKTIDTQLLATIAIKCANIETIDCRGMHLFMAHIPKALKTFRDNCLNLREIYCTLPTISGQTMHTLWPMITRFGGNTYYVEYRQALTHCHRLSQLIVDNLDQVFDTTSGQLLAKNLHKFELNYCSNNYNHRLSTFVTHNLSLKCLDISYRNYETRDSLMEMCGQLSRLTQLRELNLVLEIIGGQYSLTNSLSTIGVNCKQLKRLSLHFYTDSTQCKRQTLDSLRYFQRLKRLRLTQLDLRFTQIHLSLDSLSDCKRLTHLEINLKGMDVKVLIDCHKHCPRLQYLWIDGNRNINTYCLSLISRLPALQTLVFCFIGFNGLSDNDFWDLLSRSPKLKTIEIRVNYLSN